MKEKVENKIDQKIDKITDKIVNGPEESIENATKSDAKDKVTKKSAQVEDVKSDFVRGSQIIFSDNQTGETIGTFRGSGPLRQSRFRQGEQSAFAETFRGNRQCSC